MFQKLHNFFQQPLLNELREEVKRRKAAQEEIRGLKAGLEEKQREQTRLIEVQRIAHLGNWEWDLVNNTLDWSDEIYRIFGLTPQAFGATYDAFLRAVHPADRQLVDSKVREAQKLGCPYSVDHRILRPDGTVRHVHERAEVSRDEAGRVIKMVGTVQDITDAKLATEALHKANIELSLFRKLLDNSSDAIEVIDPITARFLDVNETACRDLGYSREELLAMRVFDIDPSLSQDNREMLDERIRKFGTARFEGIHRRKDGSTFAVETSLSAANLDKPYLLSVVRDITERKRAEQEIYLLATTDSLTGIANRRQFATLLAGEMERATRYGTPMSVVMYDIDYFKRVNDTFGHDAGDAVLQALTALVKENIRANDVVARWGGEEFMVLMPQSNLAAAQDASEKLRLAIAAHHFDKCDKLTVSFGVTAFAPQDDLNSLLKRVDDALYRAKTQGRNRVECLTGAQAST